MNRNLNLTNTNKMFGLLESMNNTLTLRVARARCSRQRGALYNQEEKDELMAFLVVAKYSSHYWTSGE